MFERFTDQARRIVVLAQEEAGMLNHDYIGTEHILLALIREGTGTAARALASLGITGEAAHGRLDSLEWRLSVLEQRVGTRPDLRDLNREIAQVRRDKEAAVDAQDFENAAGLRDQENQLLHEKDAREQEWAALPSLSEEIERLRDLLRQHGIDPQDGVA